MIIYTRTKTYDEYCQRAIKINIEPNNHLTTTLSFHDGEPEDNNLTRNFNDIYKIQDALIAAYRAGWDKEELIIKESTLDEV